jgi:DNA modification methylase
MSRVPVADVKLGWRIRKDLGDIDGLKQSIADLGLLQPIVVSADDMTLIAGLRRLKACKQLGHEFIEAMLKKGVDELTALDIELAENARRKDFDALELAEGLARRKKLYEKLHPETKVGATGAKMAGRTEGGKPVITSASKASSDFAKSAKSDPPAERFTKATADATGMSERKVQELIQIANLPAEKKAEIAEAKTTGDRKRASVKALREVRLKHKMDKFLSAPKGAPQDLKQELHHGDCMDLMQRWARDGWTCDLVLADPPYERTKATISHADGSDRSTDFGDWDKLDLRWVKKATALLTDNGQILAHAPLEAIGAYATAFTEAGLTYRGAIIWHKPPPMGAAHRSVYLSTCEAVVWAVKGKNYDFMPWKNAGAVEAHNFVEGPPPRGNERFNHPTQKPLWLVHRLLKRHAKPGATVLDPFAGIATTLLACKALKLPARGVELDESYLKTGVARLGQ